MKPKKHTITRPRSSTQFPKGFANKHDPAAIQEYVKQFIQLNKLKE